jgi:glycosyltransferase involved in cell wall biosynthesis
MKIAFYSPLKSSNHAVPSGDRLMARLLIAALGRAGHQVDVVSELRSFIREPSAEAFAGCEAQATRETDRIASLWQGEGVPDLWFCYHPYYKAPDLLGPDLARSFGLPYVTAEASHSPRRNIGPWRQSQDYVLQAIEQAAVNICLTTRDRDGLLDALPTASVATLAPFLDSTAFLAIEPQPEPHRLITVAMMRAGDKMDSYRMLACSLKQLPDIPWTLSIVGDGPCRMETEAVFASFPAGKVIWCGEKSPAEIAALLSQSAIYVWPGCGEAYGLAYLEAQAAGLPVVAQEIAGVPEVVLKGRTGILTPPGDVTAFAEAIGHLLTNVTTRNSMSAAARQFAREERSLDVASRRLDAILNRHVGIL